MVKHPIDFMSGLFTAVGQGFTQFGDNIQKHLISGLVMWLTGGMREEPIQLPEKWDLKGILFFIMEVLGLGWANLRKKLVKLTSEKTMTMAEKMVTIVTKLITEGPIAMWDRTPRHTQESLKAQGEEIKGEIFGAVRETNSEARRILEPLKVIKAGVTFLLSMTNPASGIVKAIKAVQRLPATLRIPRLTVWFFNNISRIIEMVKKIFDSAANIVEGKACRSSFYGEAANAIERVMGLTIPVIIDLFLSIIGLGGLPKKVMGVIKKVGGKLNTIIDKLLAKVAGVIKKIFGGKKGGGKKGKGKKDNKDKKKGNGSGKPKWVGNKAEFDNESGDHQTLKMTGTWDKPEIKMASQKYKHLKDHINDAIKDPNTSEEDKSKLRSAEAIANELSSEIGKEKSKARKPNYSASQGNAFDNKIEQKLEAIKNILDDTNIGSLAEIPPTRVTWEMEGKKAGWVKAEPLSKKSGNTEGSGPGGLDIEGWDYLKEVPDYKSNWVRAHLLNDNLQGPGTKWNLTPATRHVNLDLMEPQAESPAKEEVKKGRVISYHTKITYGHSGGPQQERHSQWRNAFTDFPSRIEMKASLMKFENGKWELGKKKVFPNKSWTIPEPPNLDGYPYYLAEAKGPGEINSYSSLPYSMCEMIFDFVKNRGIRSDDGLIAALGRYYGSLPASNRERKGWFGAEGGISWEQRLENLFDRPRGFSPTFSKPG